ncbi:MAG: hypothetical protein H5T48_08525, partial [Thermococcus sp.]|nr:hypothetical protein [Thermococcus sp.]
MVDVTPDGEIIVAGHTYFNWEFSNFLIFKTDENGTSKWNWTLAYSDVAYAIRALSTGDILAVGYSYGYLGFPDFLTLPRFDSEGNDLGYYYYLMPDTNVVRDALITSNEDVIVVGKIQKHGEWEWPEEDVWVLKLDKNASVKLNKTYDISQNDEAWAVAMASNGDIIVAG